MVILPANTWLYQLAMACYFISYLSSNILVLRFVLATASVFLFTWSIADLGVSVDTCVWNGVFFFINLTHGIYLVWQMRPVKFESQDFEDIYMKFFDGAQSAMTRTEFQLLSNIGFIRDLKRGSSYADQGNRPHNLSILLSGRMEVYNYQHDPATGEVREMVVNTIKPFEFVDSPQWITRNQKKDPTFLITIRAAEDCRYLMWPMEALDQLFLTTPQFRAYLEGVVGCDVAYKLMSLDRLAQSAETPNSRPSSRPNSPHKAYVVGDGGSSKDDHYTQVSVVEDAV